MHDQNNSPETVIKASRKPHTIIIIVIVSLPILTFLQLLLDHA